MKFDLVIVGSGMVGATLAYALRHTPYRIALIDAMPETAQNDKRLLALSQTSCSLLKNIGIWPEIHAFATAIKQLHVSHRGNFGMTRIHASECDLETLGHLIPAKYINLALESYLRNDSTLKIIRPATLVSLIEQEDSVELSFQKENAIETLSTHYVIGADGTYSTVRNLLNIAVEEIDYEQSALVTTTQLSRDHHHIAYERFTDWGAIAMLPFLQQQCATIITGKNSEIDRLMQLRDFEFLHTLQHQFGYRLGRLKHIGERHRYPLKLMLAKETQKKRIMLIGNAAHTLHPIAAQGLNLALQEIAQLIEQLSQNTPFENLHMTSQSLNTTLSHHLAGLFSSQFLPLKFARQLGMFVLDNCHGAKNYFLRKLIRKNKEAYYEDQCEHTT